MLLGVEGVAPHYQLIVERAGAAGRADGAVRAGVGRRRPRRRSRRGWSTLLRERTGIGIEVELVDPGAVPRSEGKAVRVVDRRG